MKPKKCNPNNFSVSIAVSLYLPGIWPIAEAVDWLGYASPTLGAFGYVFAFFTYGLFGHIGILFYVVNPSIQLWCNAFDHRWQEQEDEYSPYKKRIICCRCGEH
uniref:Uncharacterized protein n=1 Tax=Candidatus Kentrum sp. MB TaxID=2138164 RepID=A0A450XDW5_9GAMM|nr:MAG: hypothetical protein BECKMB1821G_GA0114241_102816 [Candidatus Kentron sp. MB]VFK32042.1 MAG: hypothetical protein BECKMB1821I_GA0114274_102915 [Candidatus Kentron sp. MB]VFK75669.1 MAG: hypothetical protein BECKMB1821H_GA0114242_102833 [Candidatus Kentron sp. MB]